MGANPERTCHISPRLTMFSSHVSGLLACPCWHAFMHVLGLFGVVVLWIYACSICAVVCHLQAVQYPCAGELVPNSSQTHISEQQGMCMPEPAATMLHVLHVCVQARRWRFSRASTCPCLSLGAAATQSATWRGTHKLWQAATGRQCACLS